MGIEEILAKLDPKTAARVKLASQTKTEFLPLGSYGATKATGGGVVKGRISLVYGPQSAGKSVLLLESIAKWQKMGQTCAWVDSEGTYDKTFAARLGVDNDQLIIIQERSFGKITDAVTPLLRAGVDAVVIDSISMAVPASFVDKDGHVKEFDEVKQMAAHAKHCTMMVNSLHHDNHNTAIVLLSQTTTEIGQTYTKQIPHGGKKVLFASTTIIKLQSSNNENEQIKGDVFVGDMVIQQPIARNVQLYVEKNKAGPQSRRCEYVLYYDGPNIGIEYTGEVVNEAITYGIIRKAGSWFKYMDNKWQGQPAVVKFFKDNPEELKLLEKEIAAAENGGEL